MQQRLVTSLCSRCRCISHVVVIFLSLAASFGAEARIDTGLAEISVFEPVDPISDRPAQQGAVSLQDAVSIAMSRYPGRVVRATTNERGGRRIHEVRILLSDGGRVVTVRVDAETGAVR